MWVYGMAQEVVQYKNGLLFSEISKLNTLE